jgi:POT family proton-dependent oligopeptide transporter
MPSYEPRTAPDHNETGWPSGIPFIIGNEGCERFSFYGMKAILYVYIVGLFVTMRGQSYDDATRDATAATHLFVAGVYFVPLIGGILADRVLGKYMTIMSLSVVYCLGHLALALFENSVWQESMFGQVYVDPIAGLNIGLFLICLGSGGIKPCVSAHVGDQFGRANWGKLPTVFNAFYFIINFGSTFSTLIIPVIRGEELWKIQGQILTIPQIESQLGLAREVIVHSGDFMGYTGSVGLAFGIPGILMGLATIAFWMGRKVFVHVPANPGGKLGMLDFLAGTSLFMVVGWPIFFSGYLPWWGSLIVSAGCLAGFFALFIMRQRMQQDDGFMAIVFYTLTRKNDPQKLPPATEAGDGADDPEGLTEHPFWGRAVARFGLEATEGPVAVLKIISVFAFVSVFWALFDQHSSTWIEQAKAMDRVVDLSLMTWILLGLGFGAIVGGAFYLIFKNRGSLGITLLGVCTAVGGLTGWILAGMQPDGGFGLLPSQIPSTNPIMVMILIPYTTFGLYPLMGRLGMNPHPLRRMTLGMFMAALAYVAVALIQHALDGVAGTSDKVHIVWQLVPYFIITLSEVMVSVTGLEFAYSQAPKRMKSVIMGFWLLNVTVGSLLVVLLAGFKGLSPANFFWVFAGLMAIAAAGFGYRASNYRYRDYTQ